MRCLWLSPVACGSTDVQLKPIASITTWFFSTVHATCCSLGLDRPAESLKKLPVIVCPQRRPAPCLPPSPGHLPTMPALAAIPTPVFPCSSAAPFFALKLSGLGTSHGICFELQLVSSPPTCLRLYFEALASRRLPGHS